MKAIALGLAATPRYTIPMREDSRLRGGSAGEVPFGSLVLSTVKAGGPNLTVGSTIFEVLISL